MESQTVSPRVVRIWTRPGQKTKEGATMRTGGMIMAALVLAACTAGAQGAKPLKKCPLDSVVSGTVCMDKYEASVWRVPAALALNKGLVAKLQGGKATAADLAAGGATQLGVAGDDYAPCADSGQNC